MDPNQIPGQGMPASEPQKGGLKTLGAVIVLLAVIIGGWYLYKGSFGGGLEKAPELTREQLVGEAPISASQESALAAHKREILERVSSGKPLTQEERESLGRTMLMEAHLYNFTDAETEAIFSALRQQ